MGDHRRWRSIAPRGPTLLEWALGSFHAATLLVVPLLLIHLDDGLSGALAGGGTLVGAGLYLALLASTVVTVRAILAPSALEERRGLRGTVHTVGWGLAGGAVNGIVFLLVVLAGAFLALLLTRPAEVAGLPVVAVLGIPAAAVVGVALGLVFVVVDLVALRVARALAPPDGGRDQR